MPRNVQKFHQARVQNRWLALFKLASHNTRFTKTSHIVELYLVNLNNHQIHLRTNNFEPRFKHLIFHQW